MTLHQTDTYRDNSRLLIVFCKVCGKEGLQLVIEPDCPGDKELDKNEKSH